VDYYRRLAGEHPDWEDYRRAMTADRRALIRIIIERAGPDRRGERSPGAPSAGSARDMIGTVPEAPEAFACSLTH
jgi:hypothetical protein